MIALRDYRPFSDRTDRPTWGDIVAAIGVVVFIAIAFVFMQGCQQVARTKIDPATSEARRVDSKVTMRFGVAPKPEPAPPQKVKIYVITPAPTCPVPAQPSPSADRGPVDGSGAEGS